MTSSGLSLPELFSSYKIWVSANPQFSSDLETAFKWVSYFIAGRIHSSSALSELVYSLSNLLVLFNDRIIHCAQSPVLERGHKLKTFLTVVEYTEVFLEISSKKLWGKQGKWIMVIVIQLFKCLSRLTLLYCYKETIVRCPPIAPIQRRKLEERRTGSVVDVQAQQRLESYVIKTSGRRVRSVDAAPAPNRRNWMPIAPPVRSEEEEEALGTQHTFAETIYIIKPICHLASHLVLGQDQWKPWLLSMAMDFTSLQMYRQSKVYLTRRQRLELSRRSLNLLLYILRSPFYERYSGCRLANLLDMLSSRVPLARLICQPLNRYIPDWQAMYFYMWSS